MLPINAFSIENFKSFGPKQRVPLSKINFLFGPNSQGKTSALLSLNALTEALLKRRFTLDRVSYVDNSEDITLGDRLINYDSKKECFELSCTIKSSLFLEPEYKLKPVFRLNDLKSGLVRSFEIYELINGIEVLILQVDADKVVFNFDSEFYKDSRISIEPGIDGPDRLVYEDSLGNGVQIIEEAKLAVNNLKVVPNFSKGRKIISPERIDLVNKTLNILFEKFSDSLMNTVDWIGPNRMGSFKNFVVNKENNFIKSAYLNSVIIGEMNDWLHQTDLINLGYDFIVNDTNSSQFQSYTGNRLVEYGVKRLGSDEYLSLSEVGSGINHIFQILIPFFAQPDIVIIQQPEIHLHPGLQVKLARAIIELSNRFSIQVIIETHSEHFIKAAQLEIARGLHKKESVLTNEDLSVLYISKDESGYSKVKQMELDETGAFTEPWPDDFFELSADLSLERLRQSYKSKN